jgi:hypothetical protein
MTDHYEIFEMEEWRYEILKTKRKEHNLSCVEILKDKTHLLASQKIMNPKSLSYCYGVTCCSISFIIVKHPIIMTHST